jgi:hypothetical protein
MSDDVTHLSKAEQAPSLRRKWAGGQGLEPRKTGGTTQGTTLTLLPYVSGHELVTPTDSIGS